MASAPNKRKNIHKSQVYISVWFQLIAKKQQPIIRWCLYNNNRIESTPSQCHTHADCLFFPFLNKNHSVGQNKSVLRCQISFSFDRAFASSNLSWSWYFVSSRDFLSIDILYQVENRYFGLITFFSKYLVLNSDSSI